MLGWHTSVYRQKSGGASPPTFESPEGTRLAVWQTGIGGLDWLSDLVKAGHAIILGGNGYPVRFTAAAEYILPVILEMKTEKEMTWVLGAGDTVTDKWEGRTVVDRAAAEQCPPNEWLIVEAWDES
jgi:hypothetical protein